MSESRYVQVAVNAVASRRSRVSGSVVNSSRGKSANADFDVFMMIRSADARAHRRALAIGDDARGSHFGAAADERLAVLARSVGDVAPAVIDDVDVDALQLRIAADEMPAEDHPERLGLTRALARRQGVHGIFHRVCWQHVAIVADRIGCVVVAFERDGHRQVAQVMTVAAARSPARDGSAIFRTTCRSGRLGGNRGH